MYVQDLFWEQRHGRIAPNWNHVAVHAYGYARTVTAPDSLRAHLEALNAPREQHRPEAWTLARTPDEFVTPLLGYIVGVEITVKRLVGTWFVSQQRSASDRAGVIAGLREEATNACSALADLT